MSPSWREEANTTPRMLLYLCLLLITMSHGSARLKKIVSIPNECVQYETRQSSAFAEDIFPSRSTKYINLKYMAKEKVMFCFIPKVASSTFIRLFSRIAGVPLKDSKAKKRLHIGDQNMEALRQGRYGALPSFDSLIARNISLAHTALNSPDWTRVAVFRDPAERLLSAFLDKMQATTAFSRQKLLLYAGKMNISLPQNSSSEHIKAALRSISFPQFVQRVKEQGGRGDWDPHWQPQSDFCGLREVAPRLDLVATLRSRQDSSGADTVATNTSSLRKTVEHGAEGAAQLVHCMFQSLIRKRQKDDDFHTLSYPSLHKYTRGGARGFKYKPKVTLVEHFEQVEEEMRAHSSAGYVSHAKRHMGNMYDEQLLQTVTELYQKDFQFLRNVVHWKG